MKVIREVLARYGDGTKSHFFVKFTFGRELQEMDYNFLFLYY